MLGVSLGTFGRPLFRSLSARTGSYSCPSRFLSSTSRVQPVLFRSRPRVVLRVCGIRFMSSVQAQANKMGQQTLSVVRRYDNIVKSSQDNREYRGVELANGLKVLLVSDPTTDKSAAALDVNVGHLMDSWELPGTAHFCEHMLFLGTDKYPSENEYSKFISSHAGSSNAYTASDHTNYHFDIQPDQLGGALDRFVQFFLAPQFTESATEREVCAVDSEHSNNLNNDSWRNLQIDRNHTRAGHDHGKFGTGNKKTLLEDAKAKGIDTRDALLQFHKKWYSSNIMTCCIVGKESLDELEGYLGALEFDSIANKQVERKRWEEYPYGPNELRKRIEVVPIKDTRALKIVFPYPDMNPEYKMASAHYISHLIGHEGPGSLLSELKRRGWSSSLSSGGHTIARGFGTFDVQVDLSPEGLEHTEEIVELLFSYIGMLLREGPQEWVKNEMADIGRARFEFKDKSSPMTLATNAASELQYIPFDDILSHKMFVSEYDPERITELTRTLSPDNMFYRVVSKKFEGQPDNTKEPVYGTEMRTLDIAQDTMSRFNMALKNPLPCFHLPPPNEYIPTKFDLKPREAVKSEYPRVIHDDVWTRVWFKQDDEYKLPKMVTKVAITAPAISHSPRDALRASMFIWCLNDALAEETYDADLAGLKFQLDIGAHGAQVKVSGFDEKQPLFAKHLVERLVHFKPDPLRYEVLFESIKRALQNFAHSQPYSLSQHYVSLLLTDRFWSKEQLLACCEDLKLSDVESFAKEVLSAFHVEVLVHGNATENEAVTLANDITSILKNPIQGVNRRPLFRNEYQPLREHAIENGDSYLYRHFQTTHDVSCVEVVFQTGIQNNRENVICDLLEQIFKEPAFNQLRTNEQLGYIVWTGTRTNAGTLGLQFIVQGPKDPDHVLERIEAFLEQSRKDLVEMPEEDYQKQVQAVVAKLLEKPKTLGGRFRRFWSEISNRQYDFERHEIEANAVKDVSKTELLAFLDKKFAKNAPERRQMIIFVHGKSDNAENIGEKRKKRDVGDVKTSEEVRCMEQFRAALSLYGRPKPKLDLPPIGADPLTIPSEPKAKY